MMHRTFAASLAAACCTVGLLRPATLVGQQPEQGYITTSDSARLFYKIAGRPGPGVDTIIAIHGGPGLDLESLYNDFAPALGRKHVVIFYDQRGAGSRSSRRTRRASWRRVRSRTSTRSGGTSA